MSDRKAEIVRRTAAALAAIKRKLSRSKGKSSVSLFVSHHLAELEPEYWKKHTGTESPTPEQVIDLLQLREHWNDAEPDEDDNEEDLDIFDFTFPGEVTDYVLSVQFDEDGKIEEISMES